MSHHPIVVEDCADNLTIMTGPRGFHPTVVPYLFRRRRVENTEVSYPVWLELFANFNERNIAGTLGLFRNREPLAHQTLADWMQLQMIQSLLFHTQHGECDGRMARIVGVDRQLKDGLPDTSGHVTIFYTRVNKGWLVGVDAGCQMAAKDFLSL